MDAFCNYCLIQLMSVVRICQTLVSVTTQNFLLLKLGLSALTLCFN